MKRIDATGYRCPTPTLRLQRALRDMADGDQVELLADDPMARIDVPHFVRTAGHELVEISDQLGVITFTVRKRPPQA